MRKIYILTVGTNQGAYIWEVYVWLSSTSPGQYTTLHFPLASGSGGCNMDLLGLYQWNVRTFLKYDKQTHSKYTKTASNGFNNLKDAILVSEIE